jgi:hypothetical protein
MVVGNFDIKNIAVCPPEAHAPLVVDADAVLARTVAFERFEPVAGWALQKRQACRAVQLRQFALRRALERTEALGRMACKQCLGVFATESFNHVALYAALRYTPSGKQGRRAKPQVRVPPNVEG